MKLRLCSVSEVKTPAQYRQSFYGVSFQCYYDFIFEYLKAGDEVIALTEENVEQFS